MRAEKFVMLFLALSTLGIMPVLSQEKPNVKSGFIEVDGGKLFYEEAGSGETVVMIHDGLVHHEIYDGQFLAFAENYRVIRYDRRGYGKSPKPKKEYSIVEDLNSLFEELNIDNAAVIGMSMGGGLAIDFTLEYPEKVTSLVLVGAVVSGYGYTEHFTTRGGNMPLEYYQDPESLRKYLIEDDPYEISPKNKDARRRLIELINANPHNMEFEKYQLNKPPRRGALGVLNEIEVPALIVVGEDDIPDVHSHAGAIEAGIPNARRIVVKNAGHLVPMEQPEEFNKKVLEFLKNR
ncbi:alpha/beta fold hydrolase [candidate division KSB1 bacterium]